MSDNVVRDCELCDEPFDGEGICWRHDGRKARMADEYATELEQDIETIVDAVALALGLDGGDIDGDGDQGSIIARFVGDIARQRNEALAELARLRAAESILRKVVAAGVGPISGRPILAAVALDAGELAYLHGLADER